MTALQHRVRRDDGTTMMELVVGMALMTVFMAMFTTAVIMMARTTNKVEAVTVSSAQTNQAFLTLDRTVRYASAISPTGRGTSGDWYLEFDTTNAGSDVCTQLRVNVASKQLQRRTWTVPTSGSPTATAWQMLANNVTSGVAAPDSADQPFQPPSAVTGATSKFQQLRVVLVTAYGSPSASSTRSAMTFTALNSDASASVNATTCNQLGRP